MSTVVGAEPVKDEEDLLRRTVLRFPECGEPEEFAKLEQSVRSKLSDDELRAWFSAATSSDAPLRCLKKFAQAEGDVTVPSLKGVGRMLADTFPRLGGLLYKECRKRRVTSDQLTSVVERSLHASYLGTLRLLLLDPKYMATGPYTGSVDQLWDKWIPSAYSNYDEHFDRVLSSFIAFEHFWSANFTQLGLKKALRTFHDPESSVRQSIGDLVFVGVTLALAERAPDAR